MNEKKHININKLKTWVIAHPLISQIVASLIIGFVLTVLAFGYESFKDVAIYHGKLFPRLISNLVGLPMGTLIVAFMIYPIVITGYEIVNLSLTMVKGDSGINKVFATLYDIFAMLLAILFTYFLLELGNNILFEKQWFEELRNQELHTPISHDYLLTFFVLYFVFVVGLTVITAISSNKRPPLVTVISLALMYIGVIDALLFTIQIMGMNMKNEAGQVLFKFQPDLLFVILIPLNMLIITIRVIFAEIHAYESDENRMSKIDSIPFLGWCNRMLSNAKTWPAAAIVVMIPLLGIIIAILALFGQAPDAAIKVFTETANYTFSTKIPPQNVFYDEHYLCTVAAGGHEKIVKPIRMGKRHGHDVVVNRQLCVANAFEQILEEKTPKFHRVVRDFYDKYGFPVAKLIRSKYIADIIWFLMKPLEWLFLIVIYLVDIKPEDRIASQYL